MTITMFYSKSTKGFYHADIHTTMPTDIVGITDNYYNQLITGEAQGQFITTDENGQPVLIDRNEMPDTTPTDVKWAKFRARRDQLLKDSDFSQLPDVQASMSEEQQLAWINYRQMLRILPNVNESVNPATILFPTPPS